MAGERESGALPDEQLIEMARGGDSTAVGILLERYKPLVLRLSRARFIAGGDRDDLLQEGMIGLYKAVCSYDPSREAGFPSFAALCIDRQMLRAIEASQRVKNQPLNTSVGLENLTEEGAEWEAPDTPEQIVIEKTAYDERLRNLMNRLGPVEKQVLSGYLAGLDYREIAEQIGRTPKAVDNAVQRIRRKAAPDRT